MKYLKLLRLMLVIMVLPFVSCSNKTEVKTHVRAVRVLKVTQLGANKKRIVIPAVINEKRETKLAFRVPGPLVRLNDTIGNFVTKGEVIARIDSRDFEIAVESSHAAFVLAEAELKRYQNLLAQGSVANSTYDRIEANYTLAKTGYKSAKNALGDTELRAPFAGYINHVFTNNYEEVTPGQPITSLIDLSRFEVNGWISSNDMTTLTDSSQFTCIIENGTEKIRVNGKLKEVGHKISFSKQSYPISLIIDAPENMNLRAGMTAYMEIENMSVSSNSAVEIPVTALFSKDQKSFVWVFNNKEQSVAARQVQVDKFITDDKVTLKAGLSAGERIVSAGVNYLFEGQIVKQLKGFSETNIGKRL